MNLQREGPYSATVTIDHWIFETTRLCLKHSETININTVITQERPWDSKTYKNVGYLVPLQKSIPCNKLGFRCTRYLKIPFPLWCYSSSQPMHLPHVCSAAQPFLPVLLPEAHRYWQSKGTRDGIHGFVWKNKENHPNPLVKILVVHGIQWPFWK